MTQEADVIAGVGLDHKRRKSRWPARLDLIQSASGLFLGLFMWGHMAFVSSILISKDAMWWVTKMFEGQFVIKRELLPDGRAKLILRNPATGDFSERVR